jgi:hypothetical protein
MKVERVELDEVSSREVWVLLLVESTPGESRPKERVMSVLSCQ